MDLRDNKSEKSGHLRLIKFDIAFVDYGFTHQINERKQEYP